MARTLNILFIGDIVGFAGFEAALEYLPECIAKYEADAVIVNGENIVNGKGLTEKEAKQLFKIGAHVITTGNHIWENWKSRPLLASDKYVLRPLNYPERNPGEGAVVVTLADGRTFGVVQLQGRVYMQPIDCPFRAADRILPRLKAETNVVFVDFHAEATAEKVSMGWYLDGKVSAVAGTHTHVQTADACILPKGTAYITDVGMTGPYDSVLGMDKGIALKRLLLQTAHKYESATGDKRISGIAVTVDEANGTARSIESFVFPAFTRTRA